MKFEKTYKDFVNEVINEAKIGVLKDNPHSFGKTIAKDVDAAIKKASEKKEKLIRQMVHLLPLYAQAFVREYRDPHYWTDFEDSLRSQLGSVPATRYQFMSYFFRYYIAEIMHNDNKTIMEVLNRAADDIELEKKQYSKAMVKFVKKFINNSDKYKNVFVKVFNVLDRS